MRTTTTAAGSSASPPCRQQAIADWLGHGAPALRHALEPLTDEQRRVVETLRRYDDFTEGP